jgi:hypothetical protein
MNKSIHQFKAAVILLLLFSIHIFAQFDLLDEENDHYRNKGYILLSGEQSGDYESNTYLVTDDVIIKAGQTLTFFPGTKLHFKKNTKITVEGTFICQGNNSEPITLTKLANSDYFIALEDKLPALWHGIEVAKSAQVEISNASIMYSKSGIMLDDTAKLIVLNNVKFSNNKYHNLKIGDKVITAVDDTVFSFNSAVNPHKVSSKKINKRERKRKTKVALRIIFGTVTAAGAVLAGYYHYKANDYKDKYNKTEDTPSVDKYREDTQSARIIGNIGIGVCAAGAVGLVITIPIGKKGESQ